MTKYIQGKDGKFAGSIGDGKKNVPTPSDTRPSDTPSPEPSPSPSIDTVYAQYRDANGQETDPSAVSILVPLSAEEKTDIRQALTGIGADPNRIDLNKGAFTVDDAAEIAGALNRRIAGWPRETSASPDAAKVKRLFLKFANPVAEHTPIPED